jgi:hypothetical protein
MSSLLTRRSFSLGFAAFCGLLAPQQRWGLAAVEAKGAAAPTPPMAPVIPTRYEKFGAVRIDPYDWLRDREDSRVIAYLDAENAYAKARLEPVKPLLDEIATELEARSTPEDRSVPTAYNGYFYQRRFLRGSQYPLIVRWDDLIDTPQEEIVLDIAALAAGQPRQCELGSWTVSPNNKRIAFTVDFHGNREFRVFVRKLPAGQLIDKASKMLPPILCSPETMRPSSTSATNPKRSARISFGDIGLAATRHGTCLSMRRKTPLAASRSISRSRGSSCFSISRGNIRARCGTWMSISPPAHKRSLSRAGEASFMTSITQVARSSFAPISARPTSG